MHNFPILFSKKKKERNKIHLSYLLWSEIDQNRDATEDLSKTNEGKWWKLHLEKIVCIIILRRSANFL